jgi:glucose-6-phosphate isomerase
MENITLNLQGSFIEENELKEIKPEIMAAQEMLLDRKGASSEMTGWLDCMYRMDKKELEDIKRAGRYIQENSQAFILLGIGGSYLGADIYTGIILVYFEHIKIIPAQGF